MSFFPGFNKGKETSFLKVCMEKFWLPAWSSVSTSLFCKGNFFFSLQNGTLSFFFGPFISFFFFFFTKEFFPLLIFPLAKIFHKQRASTSDFFKVRVVNKI